MRSADKEAIRIDRRLDREDAQRARDGDRRSREAALREREAAWSAASGIPMMDEPADPADAAPSGAGGPAVANDQVTGTDDPKSPPPGVPAAPSDPKAPTARVMADRSESGAQTR
jgi:hypothetical protein